MIGHHAYRAGPLTPLLAFIHSRIVRVINGLDRLVLRWQAGTLPKPCPARFHPARATKPLKFQVPNGYVWLIKLVQPNAQFGGQL